MAKRKIKNVNKPTSMPKGQIIEAVDPFQNSYGFTPPGAANYAWGGGMGGTQTSFAGVGNGDAIQPLSSANTLMSNLRYYLISNFRQILSQCYVEIGLVKTIIDIPVDDAIRGGVEIKSKQLDEQEIKKLSNELEYKKDFMRLAESGKWERLFGGSGIIVLVDDQDPESPLDIESINKETDLRFRSVDMWELFNTEQNVLDDGEGDPLQPEEEDFEYYNLYGHKIHKTRVITMKGRPAPSFIRPRLRGWGVSEVEHLVRAINQYIKAADLTFELLDEFKIDIFKFKNLVSTLLSANGTEKVAKRVAMANERKNYQNAIVLDSEDDWDHKTINLTGIAETQQSIRKQVSSEMRIPVSKLFGSSDGSGLANSTQDDLENYNAMIESSVRSQIKYPLMNMIQLRCQQLFGFIPDDLEIDFKPLRVLSAIDEETVKTQKFARLMQAKADGSITVQEFRSAINKGALMDIILDADIDNIEDDSNDPHLEDVLSGANKEAEESDSGEPEKKEKKENWISKINPFKNNKFKEEDHPRSKDGKFGSGGGTPADGKNHPTPPNKEEALAVRNWTGALSSYFKEADRGEKVDAEFSHKNKVLDKYLERANKYKGEIHRGLVIEKNEIDRILKKYKPGEIISTETKESWTKSQKSVQDRLTQVSKDKAHPVKVFFEYPDSDVGVDISKESRFEEEEEVLLPKNAKYKVKDVVKTKEGYRIIMEDYKNDK